MRKNFPVTRHKILNKKFKSMINKIKIQVTKTLVDENGKAKLKQIKIVNLVIKNVMFAQKMIGGCQSGGN